MTPQSPISSQKLTAESFRSYGKLITYPNKNRKGTSRNLWRIVHQEPRRTGWRVAYLVLRDKSIGRLECHPNSDETFEPIQGQSILFVSLSKRFSEIRCFTLDCPIILHKGIWHGLITVGKEAEIKITENNKISCRYWPFGFRIKSINDLNKRRNLYE